MKVRSRSQTHMYSILIVARVVLNVVRMIKLFGWEKKMNERIRGKRQEELKMLWKYELLKLANDNIK